MKCEKHNWPYHNRDCHYCLREKPARKVTPRSQKNLTLNQLSVEMGRFELDELLLILAYQADVEDECVIANKLRELHAELTKR